MWVILRVNYYTLCGSENGCNAAIVQTDEFTVRSGPEPDEPASGFVSVRPSLSLLVLSRCSAPCKCPCTSSLRSSCPETRHRFCVVFCFVFI